MFEAIHGSAPRMIEEGLADYANPSSILKAEAMLLRHICRTGAAEKLESAMRRCQVIVTGDKNGATGAQYTGELIALL
jgi:isocitrate dehydrogenase (NAD+)